MRHIAAFNPLLLRALTRTEAISHKRAVGQLQESKAYFQELFNSIVEGIAIFDHDGKIIMGNPALAEILGYSATDEFVGTKFLNYISKDQVWASGSLRENIIP